MCVCVCWEVGAEGIEFSILVALLILFVIYPFPQQPSGANQVTVFWEVVEQKPGPIVAAIVMLGLIELISGFAITAAKVLSTSVAFNLLKISPYDDDFFSAPASSPLAKDRLVTLVLIL